MSDMESGTHWHAVIDIGSNSVRLVIYDVSGHALVPHYNEKVMAGLGAGLSEAGKLSPQGVAKAMKALGRYSAILAGLHVVRVRAVATAAVRVAEDGEAFIARIREEFGLDVSIISGHEEARLSAVGVAGGLHGVSGLVGDLGGSSLEFCRVQDGEFLEGETHMLGPLSADPKTLRPDEIQKMVRQALGKSKLLPEAGGRFYMVGGAWRALAKLHMDLEDYPLHLLHAYELGARDIQAIREATLRSDTLSRQRMREASQRRVEILPYASLVLSEVFDIGKFSSATVSSYGLREGVIIDRLGGPADADPLLDGAALSVRLQDQRRAFGEALFEWITPVVQPRPDLFGDIALDMRLAAAACLLADSGARFHPDTRAELAYKEALQGAYASVSHTERAFIALSVGCRYARQFKARSRVEGLLDEQQIRLAKRLGAAMRLGAVYSGRSAAILEQARLSRGNGQLTLSVAPAYGALVSSIVERRLQTLANLMDLEPAVFVG